MTLKAKLFAQASAFAELQALLGTNPFRWYDVQLSQTATFPAVVANQISAARQYVAGGRLSTYFARIQLPVLWFVSSLPSSRHVSRRAR